MNISSLINIRDNREIVSSNNWEMVFSFSSSDSTAPQKETQQEDETLTEFFQEKMKEGVSTPTQTSPTLTPKNLYKKRPWSPEEKKILAQYGPQRDWQGIAAHLDGRTATACERQWYELKKKKWSPEEKKVLTQYGSQRDWQGAAAHLDGRTAKAFERQWDKKEKKVLTQSVPILRRTHNKWTPEEDKILAQFAPQRDWQGAVKKLKETGRTSADCRDHWRKSLEPRLSGKSKRDNEDKPDLEPARKKARMADSSELKDPLKEVQEPNWPQRYAFTG